MRRALEIRSISREQGNLAWSNSGVETYVWETPVGSGHLEVETVTVCETSGTVTYMRTQIAQAC